MIRINLLGVERAKTRKMPTFTVQAQQLTIACSLILVVSAAGVGWWYWSLKRTAAQVETDITTAQQELLRLKSASSKDAGHRSSSGFRSSNSCARDRRFRCSCWTTSAAVFPRCCG